MTPTDPIQCTVVLEAGNDSPVLAAKFHQVLAQGDPYPAKIVVFFPQGREAKLPPGLPAFPENVEIIPFSGAFSALSGMVSTPFLAYLPVNAPYSRPRLEGLENVGTGAAYVRPWVPVEPLGDTDWVKQVYADLGWISTPALLKWVAEPLSFLGLERLSQKPGFHFSFLSASANQTQKKKGIPSEFARLSFQSKILALVPYYNCEPWLEQCLDSLVNQTRPPQAIAVLDDASARTPLEIVKPFKKVTLLRSSENVGPYRILQSAIERTNFDGYLFQDADDWSSRDRLEKLLEEGERTDAEWIGTQEFMVLENSVYAIRYPLKLASLRHAPLSHPLCYPGSLIARKFL
ncbi:MAG TPA: glycosyltransferase family 2 protein, partial [bacterium]|nr:glycosyltransferase family 2 protein [bacterium]